MNGKVLEIAPSILAADFGRLDQEIASVELCGADRIHCDIMDGVFVPNISFGPMIVAAVKKRARVPLDVHLMIASPEKYVNHFCDAGADNLTVHADGCGGRLSEVLDAIHARGIRAGVAVNPDKPVGLFEPLIDKIDLVLVMSVFAGFGGQPFMASVLDKVRYLAELRARRNLDFDIEIDGGINSETAAQCVTAGVNVLVSGSYIFGASDYRTSIETLRAAAIGAGK